MVWYSSFYAWSDSLVDARYFASFLLAMWRAKHAGSGRFLFYGSGRECWARFFFVFFLRGLFKRCHILVVSIYLCIDACIDTCIDTLDLFYECVVHSTIYAEDTVIFESCYCT